MTIYTQAQHANPEINCISLLDYKFTLSESNSSNKIPVGLYVCTYEEELTIRGDHAKIPLGRKKCDFIPLYILPYEDSG